MFWLPTDDDLARLLGLREWGIGEHLRSPKDASVAFEVRALWRAVVEPSFDAPWALAGLLSERHAQSGAEEEGTTVIALDSIALVEPSDSEMLWHKAVLARGTEAVVVELGFDPVAEALRQMELLRAQRVVSLDGIGYRLRTESLSLHGEFRFDNPLAPSLRALEEALIRVAAAAAEVARGDWAKAVVRLWRDYAR
jgi:hypothetical protein